MNPRPPAYRVEVQPDGTYTAVWPSGSSSGWATRLQALRYAKSHKVRKQRTPLDLKNCKDTD